MHRPLLVEQRTKKRWVNLKRYFHFCHGLMIFWKPLLVLQFCWKKIERKFYNQFISQFWKICQIFDKTVTKTNYFNQYITLDENFLSQAHGNPGWLDGTYIVQHDWVCGYLSKPTFEEKCSNEKWSFLIFSFAIYFFKSKINWDILWGHFMAFLENQN